MTPQASAVAVALVVLTSLATMPAPGRAQALAVQTLTAPALADVPAGYRAPPPTAPSPNPSLAPPKPGVGSPAAHGFRLRSSYEGTASSERPSLSFARSWGHSWSGWGIGTAVGGLIGAGATAAVCHQEAGGSVAWCLGPTAVGGGIGAIGAAPIGAALSTWAFGEGYGAGGNFFAALAGAYLGAGLGVGLAAALFAADTGAAGGFGLLVSVLGTTLGAAAGYHLSMLGADGSAGPVDEAGPAAVVLPTVSPLEGGASVGATGVF